ncbi:MAG TPA: YraN family protein [Gammaproteobacteria bacterium]|nr:YraN family protein [Gammaproteobacteria bacterium]
MQLPSLTTKAIGNQAESVAEAFLKKKQLKILKKNFRSPVGEIDIIAKDHETLVFVEVKFRKSADFGQPYETVTRAKQRKIIRTAQWYLQKHPKLANKACRFDVISIHQDDINWIQNAFDTTS